MVQRLAQSWADLPTVPQCGAVGDLGGAGHEEVGKIEADQTRV
jgi:hypothetical protein